MKLIVFHFRPIENYPPVQNLLKVATVRDEWAVIHCMTTKGKEDELVFKHKVNVKRAGKSRSGKFRLWLSYISFSLIGLIQLILKRPSLILYYETISVFPVFLYKRLFNKGVKVCIHYHEYVSQREVAALPKIEKLFHSFEPFLYQNCVWISQTNETRLHKFLKDENIEFQNEIHHSLPNFPSRSWAKENISWKKGEPIKMVYVGYSLTAEGSYLKELIDMLNATELNIELNLYCFELNPFVKNLAGKHGKLRVNIGDSMPYQTIPDVLKRHHIGLILYKAKTENYIHNAPNKLFEYLSCGLDVWYPKEMLGIHPYDSAVEPRVIRLDFKNPLGLNHIQLIREQENQKKVNYYAEDTYNGFFDFLLSR